MSAPDGVTDAAPFTLKARLIACGAFIDDMPEGHQAKVLDMTTRMHTDNEVIAE